MEFIAFCPRTRTHWFGLWFILYFPPSLSLRLYFIPSHILDTQRYSITVTKRLHTNTEADEWDQENTHQHSHAHARTYRLQVKGKLCLQKKGSERKRNFKGTLRGNELATLQYVTYASLSSLSESFTTPNDPRCSCNSLSKQGGPWLGRNGREGSPLGREVCVFVWCAKRAAESDIHHLTPSDIHAYTCTPLPCFFSYIFQRNSEAEGQYLTVKSWIQRHLSVS